LKQVLHDANFSMIKMKSIEHQ